MVRRTPRPRFVAIVFVAWALSPSAIGKNADPAIKALNALIAGRGLCFWRALRGYVHALPGP